MEFPKRINNMLIKVTLNDQELLKLIITSKLFNNNWIRKQELINKFSPEQK